MKVDVKVYRSEDGESISIVSGDTLSIARDAKLIGIRTNNPPEHNDLDELWIVKRKAFLKAVAEALNVAIYEPHVDGNAGVGYYR